MITTELFKIKIINALKLLLQIMLAWLFVLMLITVFELLYSGFTRTFPESIFKFLMVSLWNDILFWVKVWAYMLPIFIGLYFFSIKVANRVLIGLLLLFSIFQLILVYYFNTTLVPLGADIFGYTLADIKLTIGASSGLSLFPVISVLLIVGLCVIILVFLPKRIKLSSTLALILNAVSLIVLVINIYSFIKVFSLANEYDNNFAVNKADYFLTSTANYFLPSSMETDIYSDSYIQQFEGEERLAAVFMYPNEQTYPFYHTDQAPDVLSPFFKPIKTLPNIVILLVEGLGRAFTNDGAYLGNFTPFLDSLSGKSLYWKNFLSIGGRTFGALPSVMGSMPFAKNGILEMGENMPSHLSLYSLLKFNGYHTSFYYGGDSKFDNMSLFLRKNSVDEIADLKTIPSNYLKLPAKGDGFSWGYADDQVYKYFLSNKQNNSLKKPELSVILTVATHDPFLINNQGKYFQAFENRMNFLGFDESKKSAYRKFKSQYSTIMYADEAIQNFLSSYQKRADYENTIFIITGDHRMAEIPLRTKIDRFHVPLIIFSPLLKRTAQMESISTHFDLTPSLLGFLNKNLKMNLPAGSSWLGDGLDTARGFRNIHNYPLIQTKTAMVDFIQGEYHLNLNQLFKLNSDLSETPIQDKDKLDQLTSSFDSFKIKNDRISNKAKLLPDSIIKKFKID